MSSPQALQIARAHVFPRDIATSRKQSMSPPEPLELIALWR